MVVKNYKEDINPLRAKYFSIFSEFWQKENPEVDDHLGFLGCSIFPPLGICLSFMDVLEQIVLNCF